MTPRKKALELIDRFIEPTKVPNIKNIWVEDFDAAKQCALIAVDEIIKAKQEDSSYCDEDGEWHNFMDFWQSVKEEIEKL